MNNLNTFLDKNSFLKDFNKWTKQIATFIAKQENIYLTQVHWKIIYVLREFYKTHEYSPAIRLMVSLLKNEVGSTIGNSLYLQSLFPISPAIQAAKIAGLPKPKRCI